MNSIRRRRFVLSAHRCGNQRSLHERVGRNADSWQFSAFRPNQKSLREQGPNAGRVEGARRQNLDDLAFARGRSQTAGSLKRGKIGWRSNVRSKSKPPVAAVRTTITALGTLKTPISKSWCLLRIMRMPFISRLSVMKANPKTEARFAQEHNVQRKTFISLPFTGGISAFAVILPQPFPR
jgi:hypothetical protein